MKWENIIFRIYKELLHLNNRKTTQLKTGKRTQTFSKDIQMINKRMKKCSISLIIRKMKIKTIVRYHFTSISMATIKETKTNKYW